MSNCVTMTLNCILCFNRPFYKKVSLYNAHSHVPRQSANTTSVANLCTLLNWLIHFFMLKALTYILYHIHGRAVRCLLWVRTMTYVCVNRCNAVWNMTLGQTALQRRSILYCVLTNRFIRNFHCIMYIHTCPDRVQTQPQWQTYAHFWIN